jgi:DNA-binding response OmpR family regulator
MMLRERDAASPLTRALPPKVVLLIEDDPDSRTELKLLLEEEGYAVLQAADGRNGLQLAGSPGADLIIVDLLLPDAYGFDLVIELRGLAGVKTLPIIALSGFPDLLTDARAPAPGFTAFLRKPPSASELCQLVRRLLDAPPEP